MVRSRINLVDLRAMELDLRRLVCGLWLQKVVPFSGAKKTLLFRFSRPGFPIG